MNPKPLAIGIIGYRGFGAFCTEAFHDSGLGRVVAYAGRDELAMAETARRYGVERTYTDWRRLVQDPGIDAVHVATPPDLHAEMAIAALEAGKHVFVEKPIATTDADAEAILAAGRAAGKVVGINYVMRYDLLYQIVEQIALGGMLGRLTHVEFQNYASDEGLDDGHWFWDRQQSGGIFVEHGVHFFDVVGAVIGAPATSVLGRTWIRGDGTGKEDRVQALVTYGNGTEASYYHAFNRPGALEKQVAQFAFEKGHLTLSGWIPTTLQLDAVVNDLDLAALRQLLPVNVLPDTSFPGEPREIRGNGRTLTVQHRIHAERQLDGPTPTYRAAVCDAFSDFARTITQQDHTPRVSGEDGAQSLRVAVAAKLSAEQNRPQEIG